MKKQEVNIVWFKRDLRLEDHAPLQQAIAEGYPLLLLYFLEPSLLTHPDYAPRHHRFAWQSATALQRACRAHGLELHLLYAEVAPTLQLLRQHFRLRQVFAHQETGVEQTFRRDQQVQAFCREHRIGFREWQQDGVERGLQHRRGWAGRWEAAMQAPLARPNLGAAHTAQWPKPITKPAPPDWLAGPEPGFQPSGRAYAQRYLDSFLQSRSRHYGQRLSKPGPSRYSCSRLSPYLAHGCLSVKEVWQQAQRRLNDPALSWSMSNFQSRLWWRSHYLQKLESEWQLEHRPLNPAMERLNRHRDAHRLQAFTEGCTGYPMVDASMRCLIQTGWLNFRMRAMLATFGTFTLWLDWKAVARVLSRVFLDFEPGIHYPQIQMQAGLTGYHPLRIFNPLAQAEQHDADGAFIKKWVPELQQVPVPLCFAPWRMTPMEQSLYSCIPGRDYPNPVVDYANATAAAKDNYWTVRTSPEAQAHLPAIWERHCLPENIAAYQKSWKQATDG